MMFACPHDPPCKPKCYAGMNRYEREAEDIEEAARLWRDYGKRAEEVTKGWESGPKSPPLQPSRSARYEQCVELACAPACDSKFCAECPNPDSDDPAERMHTHVLHSHAVPGDSTGEAAIGQPLEQRHHLLRVSAAQIVEAAYQLRKIVKEAVPAARDTSPPIREQSREEIARAGWCVSCYRLDRRCEPTAKVLNKRTNEWRTVYSEFCRWCGDLVGEWVDVLGAQGLPPIELVRLHHTHGKRVTERKIIEAMAKVQRSKTGDAEVRPRKAKKAKESRPTEAQLRRVRGPLAS